MCYEFHTVDLLDLQGDGVDERMVRHPGMGLPFMQKRAALRDVLTLIAEERRAVTYAQAMTDGSVSS